MKNLPEQRRKMNKIRTECPLCANLLMEFSAAQRMLNSDRQNSLLFYMAVFHHLHLPLEYLISH